MKLPCEWVVRHNQQSTKLGEIQIIVIAFRFTASRDPRNCEAQYRTPHQYSDVHEETPNDWALKTTTLIGRRKEAVIPSDETTAYRVLRLNLRKVVDSDDFRDGRHASRVPRKEHVETRRRYI